MAVFKMVDGIQVELGGAELADYEARLISPPVTSVSLPVRIMKMLEDASASLGPAIQAGNITAEPGVFVQIAELSVKLQELARLVPPELYAVAALEQLQLLGVLPTPLESVRQSMIAEIQEELGQ